MKSLACYLFILVLLIFFIYNAYGETYCKCPKSIPSGGGKFCGSEMVCPFIDPNDDPNYGYNDIWQCGSATNYCWYGHCGSLGCCPKNGSSYCVTSDNPCDSPVAPKPPSTTRRPGPNGCSTVSINSFPTNPTSMSPSSTNTGSSNTSNASPSNTSPSNGPINEATATIIGSVIGGVFAVVAAIAAIKYKHKLSRGSTANNPSPPTNPQPTTNPFSSTNPSPHTNPTSSTNPSSSGTNPSSFTNPSPPTNPSSFTNPTSSTNPSSSGTNPSSSANPSHSGVSHSP